VCSRLIDRERWSPGGKPGVVAAQNGVVAVQNGVAAVQDGVVGVQNGGEAGREYFVCRM